MSDFLRRRAEQLSRQGKGDLADRLKTNITPDTSQEDAEPVHVGSVHFPTLAHELHRVASILASLQFVRTGFSTSLLFREIDSLSLSSCADILARASEGEIVQKPQYYAFLADRVSRELQIVGARLVAKRDELMRLRAQHPDTDASPLSPTEHDRIAHMTTQELLNALDQMTPDDVRNRKSFYTALFARLSREF